MKLASTSWGATIACLQTTALGIVVFTTEYCCSTWSNSSQAKKVDVELNKVIRSITETVESTTLPWISAISNIALPDIRKKKVQLREYLLLHDVLLQKNFMRLNSTLLRALSS